MNGGARSRAACWVAGALTIGTTGCDPLTDGEWAGQPDMVVRLELAGLPVGEDLREELVLVWAPVPGDGAPMRIERPEVASVGLGALELRLRGGPPSEVRGAGIAVALPIVLGLEPGEEAPEVIDADELGALARAVSDDHYLVWVSDPGAQAVEQIVSNPIALEDGLNLTVGLCRPGRPSQLLVVPPERVALVAVDSVREGGCLDVFWGAWR